MHNDDTAKLNIVRTWLASLHSIFVTENAYFSATMEPGGLRSIIKDLDSGLFHSIFRKSFSLIFLRMDVPFLLPTQIFIGLSDAFPLKVRIFYACHYHFLLGK
jgi:hypothetical protein